ncbi:hypothetical protein GCM10027614_75760 [Micromonospora vulcania]
MAEWRARAVFATAAVTLSLVAVSALYGLCRLLPSLRSDQGSPVPSDERWLAVSGIVIAAAFAVGLVVVFIRDDEDDKGSALLVVLVLALVAGACSVPLWRRGGTIDVTAAGFHRPRYSFDGDDFRLYNGSGGPVRVCLGVDGVCQSDPKAPAQLRAPGLTVAAGDVVEVDWPEHLYGDFSLMIAAAAGS